MNRNDPWLQKNVSWVRQEAVVKGHFTWAGINDILPPSGSDRRSFFAGSRFRAYKKRQPTGRPTWISYQTVFHLSTHLVFVSCKSVFCTNTFCLLHIILHLEIMVFSWYLIDTKRWYQCTGKLLDFKHWKSIIQSLKSAIHFLRKRRTRHELKKLNRDSKISKSRKIANWQKGCRQRKVRKTSRTGQVKDLLFCRKRG